MANESPAVILGRKGGKARARNLTKEQIQAIGRKGGLASARARRLIERKALTRQG